MEPKQDSTRAGVGGMLALNDSGGIGREMVDETGIEPATSSLRTMRSPS
jgi:hypothetical protein